jgi:hypothetical protein
MDSRREGSMSKCCSSATQFLTFTISIFLAFNLSACGGGGSAIGMISGGVATKLLLQDMDDRATHVIQNAAASGSLVSSKAARDVQLLIDAARQSLHDELDIQWDKLDRKKIDFLRELNAEVNKIQDVGKQFGNRPWELATYANSTGNIRTTSPEM